MPIGWLMPVVVQSLIAASPKLVAEARKAYETITQNRGRKAVTPIINGGADRIAVAVKELQTRVIELGEQDVKQAELIAQIAAQTESLSQGISNLAERMNVVIYVSAGAILVAVASLIVAITISVR